MECPDEGEEDHDGEGASVGVILSRSEVRVSTVDRTATTYPGILQHAGGQDQVVDRTEHHHDSQQNKDDMSHYYTRVDFATGFVEQLDYFIFWLLDLIQIKLRVNDLVPDD